MEEFDTADFEKRLTNLKDTQDSIQSLSSWCLKNRANHKKVVSSWLTVLKQVKVEHRLILFYLANDVIQHSKRKNFEFVDSWGTTLQRATTMVRSDDKVKAKIIRIFSIWEQRDIYNDEFLADLRDLLNINPAKKQVVESDDEQVTLVSTNIRACVRLEQDTDRALQLASTQPPRLYDAEGIATLKDRRHAEDVELQLTAHATQLESCIRALQAEMKARRLLITVLEQTDSFYHNQRGEVKVVANAYRNFNKRIQTMKRKLDELCTTLPSPIPSPDINAPSPEPDNDFDLELGGKTFDPNFLSNSNGFLSFGPGKLPFDINDFGDRHRSPGGADAQPIQVIGGSSGSGSANNTPSTTATTTPSSAAHEFNIDEFFKSLTQQQHTGGASSSGTGSVTPQPVPPVAANSPYTSMSSYTTMPPRMGGYGDHRAQQQQSPQSSGYTVSTQQSPSGYQMHQQQQHNQSPYGRGATSLSSSQQEQQHYSSDEYNPESWDRNQHHHQQPQQQPAPSQDMSWNSSHSDTSFNHSGISDIETPASPPHYDRSAPGSHVAREYVDNTANASGSEGIGGGGAAVDVDHRLLRMPPGVPLSAISKEKSRALDVDHRNLISLTGSPTPVQQPQIETKASVSSGISSVWSSHSDSQSIPGLGDTDYRSSSSAAPTAATMMSERELFQPPLPPKIPLLESPPVKPPSSFVDILGNAADRSPARTPSAMASGGPFGSPSAASVAGLLPRPLNKQSPHRSPGMKRPNGGQRDNVEAIDMEMSDEDNYDDGSYQQHQQQMQQQQQEPFGGEGSFTEHSSSPTIDYNQRRTAGPPPPLPAPFEHNPYQPPPFMAGTTFSSPPTAWRGAGANSNQRVGGGGGGAMRSSPWMMNQQHHNNNNSGNRFGGGNDPNDDVDDDTVDNSSNNAGVDGNGGNMSMNDGHQHDNNGSDASGSNIDGAMQQNVTPKRHINPFGQPPPQQQQQQQQQRTPSLDDNDDGSMMMMMMNKRGPWQQTPHNNPMGSGFGGGDGPPPFFDGGGDQMSGDGGGGCDDEDDDGSGGFGPNVGGMMMHGGPPPPMMGGPPPRQFMGHGHGGPWNNGGGGPGGPGPWNNGPPMGFGGGPPMRGGGFRGGRGGPGPNGSPYFRPPGGMRGGPRPMGFRPNFRGNMRGGGGNW